MAICSSLRSPSFNNPFATLENPWNTNKKKRIIYIVRLLRKENTLVCKWLYTCRWFDNQLHADT
jgi:hypothetical protein